MIKQPPLSLYIHYPYCEKKCPYCDFNSHVITTDDAYITALVGDLKNSLDLVQNREIISIFIGGGTPSLMSKRELEILFNALNKDLTFAKNIEITIESNPSSAEAEKFQYYSEIGINRLSIGVQSFDDKYLQFLGRVHSATQAKDALENAQKYFDNFNLDLIFGLERQSVTQVEVELHTAISYSPSHISFYQLTIEPNTYFAKYPPILPSDENLYQMMESGIQILEDNNYPRYEVSAYGKPSKHNMNYWEFGDYIGIGSGAHGKITRGSEIIRTTKNKSPKDYATDNSAKIVKVEHLNFEFMLNALRLKGGFDTQLFESRTGNNVQAINEVLQKAKELELITMDTKITPTEFGFNHLNSLQELFL